MSTRLDTTTPISFSEQESETSLAICKKCCLAHSYFSSVYEHHRIWRCVFEFSKYSISLYIYIYILQVHDEASRWGANGSQTFADVGCQARATLGDSRWRHLVDARRAHVGERTVPAIRENDRHEDVSARGTLSCDA